MKKSLLLIPILSFGCARTWVNYPPEIVTGRDGVTRSVASRAIELNGSDSLGATEITVTRNSVRYVSAGGIDNSTSTRAGYRVVEKGVDTAGLVAGTYFAYKAFAVEKAADTAQAAKAGAAKPLPAAGSTIPAAIPARVVPLP